MIETVKNVKSLFKNKGVDSFLFEYCGYHGIKAETEKIIPKNFDIIVFDPGGADYVKIGFLEKLPLWCKNDTVLIAFYGTELTNTLGFVNLGCCYANFNDEIYNKFLNFTQKSRS